VGPHLPVHTKVVTAAQDSCRVFPASIVIMRVVEAEEVVPTATIVTEQAVRGIRVAAVTAAAAAAGQALAPLGRPATEARPVVPSTEQPSPA